MGVVDFTFYSTVYGGTDADSASFPALCARASDVIGAVTHWVDEATIARLPVMVQTLYKKAICAQVDFLAINGMDSLNEADSAGFTVGKVTVHEKSSSGGGSLTECISPLAIGYLEQTGLMNPQVPTLEGWW
jgi:hypothetical protein